MHVVNLGPRIGQDSRPHFFGEGERPKAASDLERLHVQNGRRGAVGPLENPDRLCIPVDRRPRLVAGGEGQQITVDQNRVAAVEGHRHGHRRRLVDQLPSLISVAKRDTRIQPGNALLARIDPDAVDERAVSTARDL